MRLLVAKFRAAAPDVVAEPSTLLAAALFSAAKAVGEAASASDPDFPSKLEVDTAAGIDAKLAATGEFGGFVLASSTPPVGEFETEVVSGSLKFSDAEIFRISL